MQTIRAIFLMIFSMALLALSDLFIKLASTRAAHGQIMLMLSIGGVILFVLLAQTQGVPLRTRAAFHRMVLLRNFFEMIAGVCLIFGIAFLPLTTFAAIIQVAPILVVMGGAIFLKERVGWRRWAAVCAGLVGMLIVIRPGSDVFSLQVLPAVIGVSALAARDLITRLSPPEIPAIALSTWGFAATIPAGILVFFLQGTDFTYEPVALFHIGCAVVVTAGGYLAITTAMRMAPASIVSPFRYSRLVFTTALGLIFLDETMDTGTAIGAAIILSAGLYTFLRERRLALNAT